MLNSSDYTVVHNDTINNSNDGFDFLIQSNADAITYDAIKDIKLTNVKLQIDKNGHHFFEHTFKIDDTNELFVDAIEDLSIAISPKPKFKSINISTYINDIDQESFVQNINFRLNMYNAYKIRITFFEKQNFSNIFITLMYKAYIIRAST